MLCMRTCEGSHRARRIRTEDGDRRQTASQHLHLRIWQCRFCSCNGQFGGWRHVYATSVATGRPREAWTDRVMPTQRCASTWLSQPLPWSHLLAWPA
jgi:hypothetical protein